MEVLRMRKRSFVKLFHLAVAGATPFVFQSSARAAAPGPRRLQGSVTSSVHTGRISPVGSSAHVPQVAGTLYDNTPAAGENVFTLASPPPPNALMADDVT